MEYKKVILPTDLSENAGAAAPYALDLAQRSDGTVYLVHVLEDSVYYEAAGGARDAIPAEFMLANRRDREARLKEKAQALAKKSKVKVVDVMIQGHPAAELVKYAKKEKADVVVIATHGRTGLDKFLYGSVAERVVQTCECPVMSIRPKGLAKK
jgi:nucleotide-binding universal stress UspA family protein